MSEPSFTAEFTVPKDPAEAFAAITHVRGWWSGEVQGDPDRLGAEFTYRVEGAHFCRMKVTEFSPGKSTSWRVVESRLDFTRTKDEWTGTAIRFELHPVDGGTQVRFEHEGLVPALECHEDCSGAWRMLVNGNLKRLIASGKDQPNVFARSA